MAPPRGSPVLHASIYKYWPISTKLDQNVYDHKISDEFNYRSNRTRTVWVICPWIGKFAIFDFVYTLASANMDQISTKLGHNIYAHKVSDEFDYGTYWIRISGVICPWIWKISESDIVYTLASTNIDQSTPNLVKMYVTIRSWMSLIMDLIRPELFELSALEWESLP